MNKKIITKILATMLVFTLTFANVALLGIYTQETFAASIELEEQNTTVNKANIEFDAYFQEEGVITHSKNIDMAVNSDKLYLKIKVSEGYLTDGKIKIENTNFNLKESEEELEFIQEVDTETNTITLNQIDKGESVILEVPIEMNTDSIFDVQNLSKISDVILEGTYVNNNGNNAQVSKTIQVSADMTGEAKANLTNEVSKYVQFDVNGEKGVILQETIASKVENNILPVKQTEIEIEIPKINGVEPTTVVISADSTKATNGENNKSFVIGEDYTYENGKIVLTIKNEQNENGQIAWEKDAEDKIVLTCVYGEKAIVSLAQIENIVNSNITLYSNEEEVLTASINETKTLNEKIGDIITYNISTTQKELNQGYMLVSGADNTEYVDTWSANIGSRELVDSVVLENKTKYLDANKNEYTSDQIYTYTKISEENLLGILGEDGYINIYDKNENKIATLDKDNLEYKYITETSYIKIETSKPISEGVLNIENGRGIKALEYSKTQEELFQGMTTTISGAVILNDQKILIGNDNAEITFVKPTSQAELTLSNDNISTVVTNEGVELRVTLKTTDASTALYKNPTIDIVFPSYVTNISAANVRILYEDELKLSNAKMYITENGNRAIRIELSGEQTKFNQEAQAEGATLIMKADITVDELTPTRTENIELYVNNGLTGETVSETTPINFVAPVGMVTVNQISNYNNKGEIATSISGKSEVGEIETNAETKTAKVNMTIINNYKYNCKNVIILGRTPFEGNKTVTSAKDLGSTFTANMVSAIQAVTGLTSNQMTVYYSSNGEATRDLTNDQNGWTTNASSLTNIKSYMIVLNDYILNTGDTISFSYDVQIPEGLGHDEETYATFAVYYNRQEEDTTKDVAQATVQENGNVTSISTEVKTYGASSTTTTESTEATAIGISTGVGPDLSVVLKADVDNKAEVEEKSIITYTASITNNASSDAEGVYLVLDIPDNASFVTDDGTYITNSTVKSVQLSVGTIEAKETKDVEFKLKAGNFIETIQTGEETGEKHFYDENGNEISEDYNKKLTLEDFDGEEEAYQKYLESLENSNGEFNTTLTLEDFGGHQEAYDEYLKALEEYKEWVTEREEVTQASVNANKITVKVSAKVQGYNDEFTSNELVNTIIEQGSEVKINMELGSSYSTEQTVGNTMEYGLEIGKNVSDELTNVVVTCKLPEGITFKSTTNNGMYNESTRTVTWTFDTLNSTKHITLICTTDKLESGTYEREVPVTFNATCKESDKTFTSNTLTIKVVGEGFTIAQTSNISDGYLSVGEEITYAITVKNVSSITAAVTVTDYLPSDLSFVKYYYTQNGKTTTKDNNSGSAVNIPITLSAGETITVYLTAKANKISTASKDITNKVVLNSAEIKDLEANSITHKLIGSSYNPENDDSVNPSNDNTYKISGLAWLDENKDGKREDSEELLSKIKVYLLDSATNKVIAETETNSNGVYTFSGIEVGKYVVAFEYDTANYNVTTYQAEGIDASVNSDTINMLLTVNGKTSRYAATDTITVASNTYNIDLGLVNSPKFDLELTKGVSLIQVSNSKGTENYTFENTDLAKIEIPSKNMNGSVVAITYTFTIENTGVVTGYAKKIVDYIPSDLTFSSTLNPEWYQDTDGKLYNSTLADRAIAPGEKVEVTLILTKTMTDENTGVVNNTAEIYEASNDQGITDIDSTPGNKATDEDDFGSADVIITVKTGGAVLYIGIAFIVLAVFALRCIWNKEKSINENIRKKGGKESER